jgi:hypothetical protein
VISDREFQQTKDESFHGIQTSGKSKDGRGSQGCSKKAGKNCGGRLATICGKETGP